MIEGQDREERLECSFAGHEQFVSISWWPKSTAKFNYLCDSHYI